MAKIVSLIIACCFFIYSSAEQSYLMEGSVGKYPITMLITQNEDETLRLRYFYNNHLEDIYLEGKQANHQYIFKKEVWSNEQKKKLVAERFTLKKINEKKWNGFWANTKLNLPVSLNVLDTNNIKLNTEIIDNYDIGIDKYFTQLRQKKVKLERAEVSKVNQLSLQWFIEKSSKVKLFRIVDGVKDLRIADKVNKTLHDFQMKQVLSFYDCPNNNKQNGEYYFNVDSVFVSDNFFSIDAGDYYDCGGIHPNYNNEYINFNLNTGQIINNLSDIFNLEECDNDAIFQSIKIDFDSTEHEQEVSASCIYKLMMLLHKKEILSDSARDEYCQYTAYDTWNDYSFLFKTKGLYINPNYPHVSQSCGAPEWSIIPNSYLKNYLKKEFTYLLK